NSTLSNRFSANPHDPVLSAEQLLASLSFVHYENPFLTDARGVVLAPPPSWQPSADFLDALFGGLSGNQVLSAVTLQRFFTEVPPGGGPNNREPTVRHLQSGGATRGITHNAANRIALARDQLGAFSGAVSGHPAVMTALGDALLTTEARGLT